MTTAPALFMVSLRLFGIPSFQFVESNSDLVIALLLTSLAIAYAVTIACLIHGGRRWLAWWLLMLTHGVSALCVYLLYTGDLDEILQLLPDVWLVALVVTGAAFCFTYANQDGDRRRPRRESVSRAFTPRRSGP